MTISFKLLGKVVLASTAVGAMVIGDIINIRKLIAWVEDAEK